MQKLLVIDDSLTVRKMVELTFRDAGWTIDFAATGSEGTTRALEGSPDVILLDFVLPDMRAIEVCERLAAHPKGAGLAVILMSAKMEKVRELFAPYPIVIDFVSKPFSSSDMLERARRAAARRSSPAPTAPPPATAPAPATAPVPPAEPAPAFTFKHREVAANAIYQQMRRELAAIPGWMANLGKNPPAMYFARKLLTPDVINGVLDALAPLYREVLAPTQPRAEEPGPVAPAPNLAGHVEKSALRDLLRLLTLGGRTGELRITHGGLTAVSYWQSGQILLVTSLDPTDYARGGPPLDAVPAGEREQAELAQRTGGVPVYVTLHERGAAGGMNLPAVLEKQGRRVLDQARAAGTARFVWRELENLPGYVEAHGRHIPLDDIETGHKETFAQLTLERLRRPSSWREAQVHLPGPDAVYVRASGFSTRLTQLSISANEQRVLTLLDGRNSVTAISERSGIVLAEVARILHRLAAIDLIVAPAGRPSSRTSRSGARPVMILEPDRDGFHEPLRALLASRPEPLDLIDLAGEHDLLGAIQRERPALVVLNGSMTGIGDVARAIRGVPHLANVSLAAVLESQAKVEIDDLAAAGFDAVLVKPVLYSDLSKLIASSFLASNGASHGRAMENHGENSRRR